MIENKTDKQILQSKDREASFYNPPCKPLTFTDLFMQKKNTAKEQPGETLSIPLAKLRAAAPRIHCLTNAVSMQDIANLLLTVGSSAIMACDVSEAEEVTAICHGLLLNTGTPSKEKFFACQLAGKRAAALCHPIVLDPVGAGASSFRQNQLALLLEQVHPDLIRCNLEEAITLLKLSDSFLSKQNPDVKTEFSSTDYNLSDTLLSEQNTNIKINFSNTDYNFSHGGVESGVSADISAHQSIAVQLSRAYKTTVLVSGQTDVISNGTQLILVEGGDQRMRQITGGGCMLSALCTAFLSAGLEPVKAAESASILWKQAAQSAAQYIKCTQTGLGSFHTALFDAVDFAIKTTDIIQTKRKVSPALLRLYAVSDRSLLKNGMTLTDVLPLLFENGVTCFQLREKELSEQLFLSEAQEIKKLCRRYNIPLIINDNVAIAKQVDADGVHIGTSDMQLTCAREILGPNAIIGASVHNVTEALAAQTAGADYLCCGAVFGSTTKKHASALPFSELCAICRAVLIPVVAIGGIHTDNLPQLSGSGIAGPAVIRALFAQPDPGAAARKLRALSDKLFG